MARTAPSSSTSRTLWAAPGSVGVIQHRLSSRTDGSLELEIFQKLYTFEQVPYVLLAHCAQSFFVGPSPLPQTKKDGSHWLRRVLALGLNHWMALVYLPRSL